MERTTNCPSWSVFAVDESPLFVSPPWLSSEHTHTFPEYTNPHRGVATMVGRVQPDRKQLPLVLLRLLCLLPTGLPVRSVDFNRGTDNITVRQGDTAILR